MSRLTRDRTAESVSRDQILRHARGQGNIHFPCSTDHEQDWQPYPVDPYSAICDDHTCIVKRLEFSNGSGVSPLKAPLPPHTLPRDFYQLLRKQSSGDTGSATPGGGITTLFPYKAVSLLYRRKPFAAGKETAAESIGRNATSSMRLYDSLVRRLYQVGGVGERRTALALQLQRIQSRSYSIIV